MRRSDDGRGIGPGMRTKSRARDPRCRPVPAASASRRSSGESDYHNFVCAHTSGADHLLPETLEGRWSSPSRLQPRLQTFCRSEPRSAGQRCVRRRAGRDARHRARPYRFVTRQLRGGQASGVRASSAAAHSARCRESVLPRASQRPVQTESRTRRRPVPRARQRIWIGTVDRDVGLVRCRGLRRGSTSTHHGPGHHEARRARRPTPAGRGRIQVRGGRRDYWGRSLKHCRFEPTSIRTPGWQESTEGVKSFDDLPKNAQAYLRRLEVLVGAPIAIISTGPERLETIVLRHPFD